MFDDISGFQVVINDEGQHSIWPADRDQPEGWRHTGFVGDREACLQHIDEVWTDLRPVSARR